ncbi:MAG: hypothetical protein QM783_15920 [Phycisphaerales bacterium]
MSDAAQIHQTLHGYSRGHRLLAASLPLRGDAETRLLTMSDFAGTRIIPGFDTYVTGYPLEGTEFYALAQTWYAPEMPRPGSVWTHTLLLPEEVVSTLDLDQLRGLPFRRPHRGDSFSEYERPASYTPYRSGYAFERGVELSRYGAAATALYGHPQAIVVAYVQDSSDVTDLFFRIWLQQWPALRRRFTFSTGSLTPRFVARSPVDLQAAPLVERFSWPRQLTTPVKEVQPDPATPSEDGSWAQLLLGDLHHPQVDFHTFLRMFAKDVNPTRDRMVPLCQVFESLRFLDLFSQAQIISLVARAFPQASEASLLKKSLLEPGAIPGVELPTSTWSVCGRLEDVFALSESKAFSIEHINIEQLVGLLTDPSDDGDVQVLGALVANTSNPLVLAVTRKLAETLTTPQIVSLARRHAGTIHLLVSQRPSLALANDLWRISASARAEIIDAIPQGSQSDEIAWPLIQQAMRLSHDELAETLLRRFGKPAVSGLLDALGSSQQASEIKPAWRRAAARRHADIAEWILHEHTEPNSAVHAIAQLLDRDSVTWDLSLAAAEKLASGIRAASAPDAQLVAAFLVSKAMSQRLAEWQGVLAATFSTVYRAAARDELSYLEVDWLEQYLPEVPGWKRWDRCYRLRKGLVELVLEHGWPESLLLEATVEPEIVRAVFDLLDKKGRPRTVLRRLASLVSTTPALGYLADLANRYK